MFSTTMTSIRLAIFEFLNRQQDNELPALRARLSDLAERAQIIADRSNEQANLVEIRIADLKAEVGRLDNKTDDALLLANAVDTLLGHR